MAPAVPLRWIFMIAFAVFGAALAVRLGWQMQGTPADWPDTAHYLASAASLFDSGRMSSERYMPLYPVLLHVAGPHLLMVQAVLSALTAALAAVLAARLFASRLAGLLAGLLVVADPLLIFYANMRLTETLFTFLLLAALLALHLRVWLLGAVLLVLAILTRPALDYLAPLLMLAFLFSARESLALTGRRLALYALVYAVLMAPWWYHNYRAYGQFVRLDLGDGIVMQLENNELFDRFGLDFTALAPAYERFAELKGPGGDQRCAPAGGARLYPRQSAALSRTLRGADRQVLESVAGVAQSGGQPDRGCGGAAAAAGGAGLRADGAGAMARLAAAAAGDRLLHRRPCRHPRPATLPRAVGTCAGDPGRGLVRPGLAG